MAYAEHVENIKEYGIGSVSHLLTGGLTKYKLYLKWFR